MADIDKTPDDRTADLLDLLELITDTVSTTPTPSSLPLNPFELQHDEPETSAYAHRPIAVHIPECAGCGIRMCKSGDSVNYICPECGVVEDVDDELETGTDNSYNTSSDSAVPVRVSGPGNHVYQKKLMGSNSNYSKTQKRNTINEMMRFADHAKYPVPRDVVREAAEDYYEVQQHKIKRGDVRKGTMAACLRRRCTRNNIDRKPKEIAEIFEIPQNELSNGEKILDDLVASGQLKRQLNNAPGRDDQQLHSFLTRYCDSLNIPADGTPGQPNYREFARMLIRFSIKYRIAESSIMSSKCAGAIYIISQNRHELGIKRDAIEKECAISKSTFSRFYQAVNAALACADPRRQKMRQRLHHLFKKYGIFSASK